MFSQQPVYLSIKGSQLRRQLRSLLRSFTLPEEKSQNCMINHFIQFFDHFIKNPGLFLYFYFDYV